MILRPYQTQLSNKAIEALNHGNTIAIAPTGSGKTIILSCIIDQSITVDEKALVLQHRNELMDQNQNKFTMLSKSLTTSFFNAQEKDTSGNVIFAMAQTLNYQKNLDLIPLIHLLVIDEAHHAAAKSYIKIMDALKARNPNLKILGLTATPLRSDRKKLHKIFTNVAGQIHLRELIMDGHLVAPRTFIIDQDYKHQIEELINETKGSVIESQFLMNKASLIMNQRKYIAEVIKNWRIHAQGKSTVIFCTNVAHAKRVAELFNADGIPCACVYDKMNTYDRNQQASNDPINVHDSAIVVANRPTSNAAFCSKLVKKLLNGRVECFFMESSK